MRLTHHFRGVLSSLLIAFVAVFLARGLSLPFVPSHSYETVFHIHINEQDTHTHTRRYGFAK